MSGSNEDVKNKAKVISRIHQQLATGFYPALKHVAASAVAFQKTQESNQRAFADYLSSLKNVVASSRDAEPEAQQTADELSKLVKCYSKIGEETSKMVSDFAEIAVRLHSNAEAEKENHRKALKKYLKDQQTIHREFDKKRQTSADLASFYQEKYAEAIRLQHLRYKYFTDKHDRLLRKFGQISKLLTDDISATLGDALEETTVVSLKTESRKTYEQQSPPISEKNESKAQSQSSRREESAKFPVFDPSKHHEHDLMSPVSQPDDTIGRFFKEIKEEEAEFNAGHGEAPPSIPPYSEFEPVRFPSRPSLQQMYVPAPPPIREEPVQPLPRPVPKPRETRDDPPVAPVSRANPQIAWNNGYAPAPLPAVPPRSYEIETILQPPPPPAPKRKEKPLFTAADYGSILICTEAFTSKTDRQLSLNSGDAAELIRCGERGWLLIRTFSANSPNFGWFPAKFVRLASPTEEQQRRQIR